MQSTTRTIADIADVQIGYPFKERFVPDPEGEYPVIQVKDVRDELILDEGEIQRVTPKGNPSRYLVREGDVLFLSRGNNNSATVVPPLMESTIAASYFYILRLKTDTVLPEYLAWYLNAGPGLRDIWKLAAGTITAIVPKKAFQTLKIRVPPVDRQHTIVEMDILRRRELSLLDKLKDRTDLLARSLCVRAIDHSSPH